MNTPVTIKHQQVYSWSIALTIAASALMASENKVVSRLAEELADIAIDMTHAMSTPCFDPQANYHPEKSEFETLADKIERMHLKEKLEKEPETDVPHVPDEIYNEYMNARKQAAEEKTNAKSKAETARYHNNLRVNTWTSDEVQILRRTESVQEACAEYHAVYGDKRNDNAIRQRWFKIHPPETRQKAASEQEPEPEPEPEQEPETEPETEPQDEEDKESKDEPEQERLPKKGDRVLYHRRGSLYDGCEGIVKSVSRDTATVEFQARNGGGKILLNSFRYNLEIL